MSATCNSESEWALRLGFQPSSSETYCTISALMHVIGGKWKLILLANLAQGPVRFGELSRRMPECSEKMLIQSLRELEQDGLVHRKQYPEVPPRVEYSLTNEGHELLPALHEMRKWGKQFIINRLGEKTPGLV